MMCPGCGIDLDDGRGQLTCDGTPICLCCALTVGKRHDIREPGGGIPWWQRPKPDAPAASPEPGLAHASPEPVVSP